MPCAHPSTEAVTYMRVATHDRDRRIVRTGLPHHGGWRTLYPLLEKQGFAEITSETDTWLAGFVDGALVAMGLEPHNS